jgi:hypothetical protein
MTPPCFACAQSFFTWRQKMRPSMTIRTAPPRTITTAATGCDVTLPKLTSKLPGTERKR